jgi:general secretion pathway protein G
MVVIAIIGTLAGIAVPIFATYLDRARVARAQSESRTIEKEIISFKLERDRIPTDLAEIGLQGMLDPYGNPYQYQPSTYIDKKGNEKKSPQARKDHNLVPVNTDFDLYSMGKDGDIKPPYGKSKLGYCSGEQWPVYRSCLRLLIWRIE